MELKEVVLHSACDMNLPADAEELRPNSSTRHKSARGLICRKGVWHIDDEASFAFWNAVKPSVGRTMRSTGAREGHPGLARSMEAQRNAAKKY